MNLIDCGRASRITRGFAFMPFYERGAPPYNTTYF
jgi:hypothetical protein